VKHKCIKCGKRWQGWAQPAICPDCGGKLENVDEEKEEKEKIKENVKKFIRSK